MADFAQKTIIVEHGGETYEFGLLTPAAQAKVGNMARFLRARDDPNGSGTDEGLDPMTNALYEAMALLTVLLRKSSAAWPWSADGEGAPTVDAQAFPFDAPVFEVYQGYLKGMDKFRGGGVSDQDPGREEAVAGQPDPGDQPV